MGGGYADMALMYTNITKGWNIPDVLKDPKQAIDSGSRKHVAEQTQISQWLKLAIGLN